MKALLLGAYLGLNRIYLELKGRGIEICPNVREDVQIEALLAINAPQIKKTRNLTICSNNDAQPEIISTLAPKKKAKNFHRATRLLVTC